MAYGNNCSSGIEPIFSLLYNRKVKIGGQEEDNTQIITMMDYAYYLYNKMKDNNEQIDFDEQDIFVTALNIDVQDHIDMLAVIAKHIDMSVSKTINVPTDYPFELTKNIYMDCWKKGIKGCTIFRPNSIRPGILTTDTSKQESNTPQENINTLQRGDIISCDDSLVGKKRKIMTGCGSTHILAYFDPYNGDLMEVYLNKGSTGGCANYMTGLSRMLSLLCRAGVAVHDIKDQLDSTGACPSYAVRSATKHDTSKGSCCPMAIGNALVDMWEEMQRDLNADESNITFDKPIDKSLQNDIMETEQERHDMCPECGEPLQHSGGCDFCVACGFSHCG